MADLKEEVMIDRPLEEVFSYASNLENSTDVLANVVEVNKLTEGPVREGTQFEEIREFRNRKVGAVLEVVKYQAPNLYSIKSVNKGLEVVYHYVFEDKGSQTRVRFTGEVTATKLSMKLMRPLMVKMLKKEDGEHLISLKRAIEEQYDTES
ncbi:MULTISPECIES: SRPBCC family protein [Alteribacter]|uniref:Polyketide cyclase / dehydrase and lipid transport n=1 Tax=Alteribacter keqinensis TaxID=2483800 RepID=A0A3M7TXH6_9BACI|nr:MULTISPECIES: SRPBCC family protein [Alteribacter]MBM7094289.1 SRPBCC family protein [Alteribacter salitolerans]RNA69474.1 hypothetical protein EBO34_05940 [Alteribacter keqinensis]